MRFLQGTLASLRARALKHHIIEDKKSPYGFLPYGLLNYTSQKEPFTGLFYFQSRFLNFLLSDETSVQKYRKQFDCNRIALYRIV